MIALLHYAPKIAVGMGFACKRRQVPNLLGVVFATTLGLGTIAVSTHVHTTVRAMARVIMKSECVLALRCIMEMIVEQVVV